MNHSLLNQSLFSMSKVFDFMLKLKLLAVHFVCCVYDYVYLISVLFWFYLLKAFDTFEIRYPKHVTNFRQSHIRVLHQTLSEIIVIPGWKISCSHSKSQKLSLFVSFELSFTSSQFGA